MSEMPDYLKRYTELLKPVPDAEYIESETGNFLETRRWNLPWPKQCHF